MNTADLIVIGIIAVCLFGAIKNIIKQKKSGKCVGCSQCTAKNKNICCKKNNLSGAK